MTRQEAIKKLEWACDEPIALGLLRRIRDSKFYRRPPRKIDDSIDSEPTDRELINAANTITAITRASDRASAMLPDYDNGPASRPQWAR
jgi:hypothetical protein